jgi:hypothetical protein
MPSRACRRGGSSLSELTKAIPACMISHSSVDYNAMEREVTYHRRSDSLEQPMHLLLLDDTPCVSAFSACSFYDVVEGHDLRKAPGIELYRPE